MRTVRLLPVSPSMHCAGGGVCSQGGVSAPGGSVCSWGCLLPGGCIPACNGADPLPPVNRMTDRCKNITLPQTSFAGGNKTVPLQLIAEIKYNASMDHLSYLHPNRKFGLIPAFFADTFMYRSSGIQNNKYRTVMSSQEKLYFPLCSTSRTKNHSRRKNIPFCYMCKRDGMISLGWIQAPHVVTCHTPAPT